MTEFGTKRSETVIVQTFDARSATPDTFNPYLAGLDRWHGARMVNYAYLWEMDTGTGKTVNELAAEPAQVLDNTYTKFRVKLRQGVYWSDGVEFTADDIMYTLQATRANVAKLPRAKILDSLWKTARQIDKYTFEVETTSPGLLLRAGLGPLDLGRVRPVDHPQARLREAGGHLAVQVLRARWRSAPTSSTSTIRTASGIAGSSATTGSARRGGPTRRRRLP